MQEVVRVPFHGDEILSVVEDGVMYVAVKPICERLGLDWRSQHRKLSSDPRRWGMVILWIPSAGGTQETTCIPLTKFFAWLVTLHPNKVAPEVRPALELYQAEADEVLFRHFTGQKKEVEEQLSRLERAHRDLASWALAFNPLWGKIAHAVNAGVPRGKIYRFINRPWGQTFDIIEEMERVGVIRREDWRPSMFRFMDERGYKEATKPTLPAVDDLTPMERIARGDTDEA